MAANNDYRINWKKLAITQEGEGTIVHPLVALACTPIIGLAFLMFLPFIGFYLSAQALCIKIVDAFDAPVQKPVGATHLVGTEPGKSGSLSETEEKLFQEIQSHRVK